MEKVIGQRVLGGVVLVAAAILFLPMVLEGAGVAALQPPEMPAKPALPTAGDLAPALQNQAVELEKSIADSHGEPTFYPVQPTAPSALTTTEDVPERFHLSESPDSELPTQHAADTTPADPLAKPVAAPVIKPIAKPVVAIAPATTTMPAKVVTSAAAAKATVPVKVTEPVKTAPVILAKTPVVAPAKAPDVKPASQGLPAAWVVQVASLSSQASADELVAKLRKRGFRAAAVAQGGVFKVSVGPELDRGIVDSLKQRLSDDAELKLNGFILPYRP